MPTIRKTARSLFAVALLAAGFSVTTPMNAAHAMNQTPCTTGDLLHIWGHYDRPLIVGPSGPFEFCAANAGTMSLGAGAWVDKISTGNNDIQMNDANGDTIRISRWNIVTYPNRPPNITSIQIFWDAGMSSGGALAIVAWRRTGAGRTPYRNVGAQLRPGARGRGIGTAAQRLLVDHLFAHSPVVRLEADTETGNVAEQRFLERAEFTREGVMRAVRFRDGQWRDAVRYAVIRGDTARPDTAEGPESGRA